MSEIKKLNIIITGCNTGIGLATLKGIVTKYADQVGTVVMACRNQTRVKDGVDSLKLGTWDAERCTILPDWISNQQEKNISKIISDATNEPRSILDRLLFIPVELNNVQSVTSFSKIYLALNLPLDILILNAGIASTNRSLMFESNVLGHYHLTRMLLQNLVNSKGKIVVVSSDAHGIIANKLKDNESIRDHIYTGENIMNTAKAFKEYGFTKLCNLWFSNELHKRYNQYGIRVNALHPGAVRTTFGNDEVPVLLKPLVFVAKLFFISADEGAKPSLHLAFSPEIDQVSGKYFNLCKESAPYYTGLQENRWTELWDLCEQLVIEKLGNFQYEEIQS